MNHAHQPGRIALPLILLGLELLPRVAAGQSAAKKKDVLATAPSVPIQVGKRVLGRIRRSNRLPLIKTQGQWHQVEYNDGETTRKGWIHSKFVKIVDRRLALRISKEAALRMANFSMDQGRRNLRQKPYIIAQAHFMGAVEKREKHLGKDHLDTAEAYHYLAEIFLLQQMYEDARLYFGDAVAIRRAKMGSEHADTAASLHGLGQAFLGQGKLDNALTHFHQAYTTRSKALGDHLDTAATLEAMISIYDRQNKLQEKREALQNLLSIYQEKKGPEDTSTVRVKKDLEVVSQKLSAATGAQNRRQPSSATGRNRFVIVASKAALIPSRKKAQARRVRQGARLLLKFRTDGVEVQFSDG